MEDSDSLFNFMHMKYLCGIPITRDAFYALEAKGEIPPAVRKGASNYRYWTLDAFAQIGETYSVLEKIGVCVVISVLLTKGGGSHKTTTAMNLACYLALNGKKVLLIPLDFQLSLSKKFGFDNSINNVKRTKVYHPGLFEVIDSKLSIDTVIKKTRFPNIDIIPESANLIRLEVLINSTSFRESVLRNTIAPIVNNYDVIIFDNNPAWDILRLNSLCASDILISPIGIDSNSAEALPMFLETLDGQLKGYTLKEKIFVPGFAENTALKREILEEYREKYPLLFTRTEIRRLISIDEASTNNMSIFEYAPKSTGADDYKKVCDEIWTRIATAYKQKN